MRITVLGFAASISCTADDASSQDTDSASTGTAADATAGTLDDAPGSLGSSEDDDAGEPSTGSNTDAPGTMTSADDTGSSSGGAPSCTSDDECADTDAPFCVGGTCVPCDLAPDADGACASLFPDAPLCVGSTCVQCTEADTSHCSGSTPICDTEDSVCIGCRSHDDCPDSACHIPAPSRPSVIDGACFDPATVVHVDPAGTGDFTSIEAAVLAVPNAGEGVIIVHDGSAYEEAVELSGDRDVAILGAPGESPVWLGTDPGDPQLSITGASAVVFLHRMRVEDNPGLDGAALDVTAGRLHLQRSRVVNNEGGGILADVGALLHVENSYIGGPVDNVSAIEVDAADATILYSTIATGYGLASRTVECSGSSMDVRNSILVAESFGDSVACSGQGASFLDNASDQDLGPGNELLDEFDGHQNLWLGDYAAGDFSLDASQSAVFYQVGVWQEGDPLVDIDGDPRPNRPGMSDAAGADTHWP